jgi:K+-sensing histidine kinase KdpD
MEAIMKNIMVCVTQQKTCDRLIRYGRELLDDEAGELTVIHVADGRFSILGSSTEGEALDYLYEKAKEYGASLTVLKSDDVLKTLIEQAQKNRADIVVMGESREGAPSNIAAKLEEQLTKGTRLLVMPA